MCTALSFSENQKYFGRNLDLHLSFNEEAIILPRNFSAVQNELAILGIGTVKNGYPLFYDAMNEHGIAMAGLNFIGNARFHEAEESCFNIPQYALIPFILGKCKTLDDAKSVLSRCRILKDSFDNSTPPSELHYFLTDGDRSLTAGPAENGIAVYENEVGVLTNNPPFPYHVNNLSNYINLTSDEPKNRFSDRLDLKRFSLGMGSIGLPGDYSSPSRFVRAAFVKFNSCINEPKEELSQIFHILESVSQPYGAVKCFGSFEKTQYTSVANLNSKEYFYKTYENSRICAIRLTEAQASENSLSRYPLKRTEDVLFENV